MMARLSSGSVAVIPSSVPWAPRPVTLAAPSPTGATTLLRQRELNRRLSTLQELERTERRLRAFRAERHDVEVHIVELNFRVEHGQTGSGKVHRRELYVIAVQDLLHHVFVQLGSVLATSLLMPSLRFGSDCHQECASATREISHTEEGREFVIRPVDPAGPAVKDKPREERRGGNGRVVRAGELGVCQQRVEEAAGEVMPLKVSCLLHRLHEGSHGTSVNIARPVGQNVKKLSGQIEYRNIVDALANEPPRLQQTGNPLSGRFLNCGDILPDVGEAILKCKRIEDHQAGYSASGGAVLFLISFGNQVGNPATNTGMCSYLRSSPLQLIADHLSSSGYAVNTLQFQRKGANLVGKLRHGPDSHGAHGQNCGPVNRASTT